MCPLNLNSLNAYFPGWTTKPKENKENHKQYNNANLQVQNSYHIKFTLSWPEIIICKYLEFHSPENCSVYLPDAKKSATSFEKLLLFWWQRVPSFNISLPLSQERNHFLHKFTHKPPAFCKRCFSLGRIPQHSNGKFSASLISNAMAHSWPLMLASLSSKMFQGDEEHTVPSCCVS